MAMTFVPDMHKKYLNFILNGSLPSFLISMDTNRSLLMYFAISSLDVLNELENLSQEKKDAIIDWIYALQVTNERDQVSGFIGSPFLNFDDREEIIPYKWAHIANTYSCLCSLLSLQDDFSRLNREAILNSLRVLQLPNGCFKGSIEGVEDDMRFVFCAASICYILNDWSTINKETMVNFILQSISYDGGIAQGPNLESHSGSTFCALAALALSNNLHRLTKPQRAALRRWLVLRFSGGFSGRPNKPIDTCYSFWTGGALKILDAYEDIHHESNCQFIIMTQDRYGGFSKWTDCPPDPMHTYLGLAGLSLMGSEGLSEMFSPLSITSKTHEFLKEVQNKWK